jgi:hypothetical protein
MDNTDVPQRIQRKRTKGWKMPENTVYVGRPGKWGNPYIISHGGWTREVAVDLFRKWVRACGGWSDWDFKELRGQNLACWCPIDQPCHADVLLEIAND